MGHNITRRDGSFTVREPAWHGLSEVLPDYPTREQAQAIAHPWEPVSEPVYRKVPRVVPHLHSQDCRYDCTVTGDLEEVYEQIEGSKLMTRDDDGHPLGVVNDSFEPVLNREMYDIAEAIEAGDPASVRYETGGSLRGGAKVWLLLRLKEPLHVSGDPNGATIPYYALQNDHTGGGAFRGQALMTRIVCDNTSQMADLEAQQRGTEFVFRHTRNVKVRIEQARRALACWRESVERYNRLMEQMLDTPVTEAQRERFVQEFIPMPLTSMHSDRVMRNVTEAQQALRKIYASVTCQDVSNTAYGLVQGAIEYAEHYRKARSAESRFKRAYLDRSLLTADAFALAGRVAGSPA